MQFLQICVHPQDIGGAEGPKTSMFVIFGPSVERFKNRYFDNGRKLVVVPVQFSFVKRITFIGLSFICYGLQLPCLNQIEKDFKIITLHFLFSLLLVTLEQLIKD